MKNFDHWPNATGFAEAVNPCHFAVVNDWVTEQPISLGKLIAWLPEVLAGAVLSRASADATVSLNWNAAPFRYCEERHKSAV